MNHEPQPQPPETAPDAGQTSPEQAAIDHPQIWIGSLSDYNNGILYGAWLDAARSPADIYADITRMLAGSPWTAQAGQPAEEWGIFDHDNFGPLRIAEHESIETVSLLARGIAEHGPAFAAYAELLGSDPDELAGFADAYVGHYDSLNAYVQQMVEEMGYEQVLDEALPDSIRRYVQIDIEAIAHDMWLGGEISVMQADTGGVWIFHA